VLQAGDDLARFKVEAEAVARLQHPNIIQIHEIGEHNGLPYFSLEFCAGGSLAQRLNGTPLPAAEAAQLIETLARAMHTAHMQQVVHRDLKPANILLTADGRPKITDFGLAKKLDEGGGRTHTGEVMGTPSYMAPEQAGGRLGEIGPATDVYALGALLYELLTGRAPFRAASPMETLQQVLSNDPVALSRLQPRTPRDLETICLKCLQKEPRKRYASALELADDLARFRGGESIRARPVSMMERGLKWARQRPAVAGLLAGIVGVTALAFFVIAWELRQTEDARQRTADALAEREAALAERESQLYFNHITLADREWLADHVARVEDLLGGCPPSLRHWEWRYLNHLCHSAALTLPGRNSVAFSADGRRLAEPEGNDVHVRDADTGKEVALLHGHTAWVTAVAFDRAGRIATASLDRTVKVWDARGRELVTCAGSPEGVTVLAFSPDGRRLAGASAGGDEVLLWTAATGQLRQALEGHTGAVTALAFAPDGETLVSGSRDGTVRRWDPATGRQLALLRGHSGPVTGLAFRPDGKQLASAGEDEEVILWDPVAGRQVGALREFGRKVTAVAYGPKGKVLASAAGDFLQPGEVKLSDPASGRPLRVYRGQRGIIRALAFQSHGNRLASADGEAVLVWDATTVQEARVLEAGQGALAGIAVSPDGKLLASAGADGTVKVWDAVTGRETATLRGHEGAVASVTFCGRTGRLATGGFDHTVRVWDLATGKEVAKLLGHEDWVWCVASNADGSRIASCCGDGSVKVWDPATGREVVQLQGHHVQAGGVAFSPDGKFLASASVDLTVKVWSPDSGAEVRTLKGHSLPLSCLAFSPDGRWLASGGGNDDREEAKLWDLSTGQARLTLAGHIGKVTGLAFSADGRRLAGAERDHTVRIWETAHGLELLTLRGHGDTVTGVVFGPDDRWLASSSLDGTVRIWEAPPE
jgi:WD40 repeat protein